MNGTEIARRALAKLEIAVQRKFTDDISGFQISDETEEGYTVDMKLGDAASINLSLRTSFHTMILRSDSEPKGLNGSELEELGTEIMQKIPDSRMTSYDGILTMMKAVSFSKMNAEDPERLIFNEAMGFIQTLVIYRGKLTGEKESKQASAQTFEDNEELDPFGFDSITDEDVEKSMEKENTDNEQPEDVSEQSTDPELISENVEENRDTADETDKGIQVEAEKPEETVDPVTPVTGITHTDRTEDEVLLSGLLDSFEAQDAPSYPASAVMGAPEGTETDAMFGQDDDYCGTDQFGLIGKTREFKESAEDALSKIKEILVALYQPMYSISAEIYERNDQLASSERNIQLKLDAIGNRQKELDRSEAEYLARQQSLLQERTKFNDYKESVRNIINDYEVKVHLVKEMEDEIKLLKYDLSEQRKTAAAYKAQIERITEGGETIDAAGMKQLDDLKKANNALKGKIAEMSELIERYHKTIETFKRCQSDWNEKEKEYEAQNREAMGYVKELSDLRKKAEKADERLEETEKKVKDLETACSEQRGLAEKAERKAKDAETKLDETLKLLAEAEEKSKHAEERASELEQALKDKDEELSEQKEENDISRCANIIKDGLQAIGITSNVVPGEGKMVLEAESENCSIAINVDLFMIYISKQVRKGNRFTKQVEDLNKLDIRTTYAVGEREITCKSAFKKSSDAAMQVKDILDSLKEMK